MHKIGYVALTFKFSKEGRRWVGLCEELGTASFGRSIREAEKRLEEAVLLHLNTLEEVNERNRFFEEHNIKILYARPKDIMVCLSPDSEVFVQSRVHRVPELCVA